MAKHSGSCGSFLKKAPTAAPSLRKMAAVFLAFSLLLLSACQGNTSQVTYEFRPFVSLYYQDRQYEAYTSVNCIAREKQDIEMLLEEYLGEARPSQGEAGEETGAHPDLTGNFPTESKVYTLEDYDPRFLLCRLREGPEGELSRIVFHQCLDDFTIATGEDLFGNLLHLHQNAWGLEKGMASPEGPYALPENWDAFLEELYAAPVATPGDGELRQGIYIFLNVQKGMQVSLHLNPNGWVGFSDTYFRVEGEEYRKVYAYCQGFYATPIRE